MQVGIVEKLWIRFVTCAVFLPWRGPDVIQLKWYVGPCIICGGIITGLLQKPGST